MVTSKTHFEQVPLEIVSKVLRAEIQAEETTKRAQQRSRKVGRRTIRAQERSAGSG
jgi:hypothetical protein